MGLVGIYSDNVPLALEKLMHVYQTEGVLEYGPHNHIVFFS